jgi:hypothetical protein
MSIFSIFFEGILLGTMKMLVSILVFYGSMEICWVYGNTTRISWDMIGIWCILDRSKYERQVATR